MGDIREQPLPGIGHRYDLDVETGRISVVIHHSGRRDLYVFEEGADRPTVCTLTDDEARRLGAIVGGAYFRPALIQDIEAVVGGLVVEWVTLRADSPGAGHTIADLEVRKRTHMTVVAVVRDDVQLVAPPPDEVLQAGDRVVVIGRPDDLPNFVSLVVGSRRG
jgi:TrkA domain protein